METVSHFFSFYAYLQNTWRSLQIHRFNRQIAAKIGSPSSSLSCLPDDIILMVFDLLDRSCVHDWQIAQIARSGRPNEAAVWRTYLAHQNSLQDGEGDLLRFSMSNRRIRQLAERRLFRTVTMGSSWSAERASKALESMGSSESARQCVKEFKLDIWSGYEAAESAKRLLKFSHHFVGAVQALAKVEKMTLTVPASTACALHYAFRLDENEQAIIRLPNVKELILSPFMHWMIDFCPNVRSVESNDWVLQGVIARHDQAQAIIEAAGRSPFLKHFSLHCRWRLELLEQVAQRMPDLQSLALRGGQYSGDMSRMLVVLKRLQSLETLELLDAHRVDEILHRHNSFHDWLFPFYREEGVTQHQKNVTSRVFRELETLKLLCLGRFKARLLNREETMIDVRWEIDSCQPSVRYIYDEWGRPGVFYTCIGEWRRVGYHPESAFDQKLQSELADEDEELQLQLLQEEMVM